MRRRLRRRICAFLACALPLSVAWFFAWRFLSGLAGCGYSSLFELSGGTHRVPMAVGIGALMLALLANLVATRRSAAGSRWRAASQA